MNDLVKVSNNLPARLEDLTKFVLVGREKLNSVRAEIRAIDKLELAGEVREQKKEEAQMLAGALLDAEVKIGELISEMPKAKTGPKDELSNTTVTKLSEIQKLGFNKMMANRFQQMAQNPDIVEQVKAEAKEEDDLPTRTEVLRRIKENNRKDDIAKQKKDIETEALTIPKGKFDVICIDPPWNYGREYDPNGSRVANPYPEMTQEQLKEIDIPSKDDAVMFLWTTHAFIFQAKELLDHWGFEYKATLVWDKENIGMGAWLRMQCEFCLVGVKGKPYWQNTTNRDIIREARREHSRKPEAFYKLVDEVTAGRKLDYFAREKHDGWEVFGNDVSKF